VTSKAGALINKGTIGSVMLRCFELGYELRRTVVPFPNGRLM
jgi:hypothetical protein